MYALGSNVQQSGYDYDTPRILLLHWQLTSKEWCCILPIVTNDDDLRDFLCVQNVNHILSHQSTLVHRRIGGFVSASISKHIWGDNSISLFLKEGNYETPILRSRGETMAEKQGRFRILSGSEVVVIFVATGGVSVLV